ncbi:MAG: hypothetical protein VXY23_09795 [Pseudomonadota bacterium]|jgi:hypothetical protein|nr:hypothetical protein [Pseudomonadota bacterium]
MFWGLRRMNTPPVAAVLALMTLVATLTLSSAAKAALIGASSAPKLARVPVEEGRTLQIRWIISTTSAHSTGAFSAQGVLKDAATSTVLKTQTTPFNQTEGAGPLHFEEPLTITADEAKTWLELGYRTLEYNRQFSTGSERPSTVDARVSIRLSAQDSALATPHMNAPLAVHNQELSFKPQRFRSQVSQGLPLQAQLTVTYSGQGQLKGSWQLATVNPDSGQLVYRELAQVSKDLQQGMKDWLLSPQLETSKPGLHVLRFCALETLDKSETAGNLCPNPQLSTTLQYEVIENQQNTPPPSTPATLSAGTQLSWPATADTIIYELVLRQENGKESLTSGDYVGRLLIAAPNTATALSPQLLDELKPGATYQWQVSALDRHGDLIRQTAPARFIFMP